MDRRMIVEDEKADTSTEEKRANGED